MLVVFRDLLHLSIFSIARTLLSHHPHLVRDICMHHLSIFLHNHPQRLYHTAFTRSSRFLVSQGPRVRNIRSQLLCHLPVISVDVLYYHIIARSLSQACQWNMLHRDALSNNARHYLRNRNGTRYLQQSTAGPHDHPERVGQLTYSKSYFVSGVGSGWIGT